LVIIEADTSRPELAHLSRLGEAHHRPERPSSGLLGRGLPEPGAHPGIRLSPRETSGVGLDGPGVGRPGARLGPFPAHPSGASCGV
jgi:hypothetical protein